MSFAAFKLLTNVAQNYSSEGERKYKLAAPLVPELYISRIF